MPAQKKPTPNPLATYPQRVPIKVIGREGELDQAAIASIVVDQLGEQDRTGWHTKQKGKYVSHTIWVELPGEGAEARLRHAIHRLPGIVMQL